MIPLRRWLFFPVSLIDRGLVCFVDPDSSADRRFDRGDGRVNYHPILPFSKRKIPGDYENPAFKGTEKRYYGFLVFRQLRFEGIKMIVRAQKQVVVDFDNVIVPSRGDSLVQVPDVRLFDEDTGPECINL